MTCDNSIVSNLKEQHQKKIEELEDLISKLQQEIELIKQFDERLDDL
jgi:hypothetical protein